MKLKLDDKGNVVLQDGKPVYIDAENKEIAFDAAETVNTISRLRGEAMGHRKAKETAEAALKAFEGITDAEAAKKALETVSKLDTKKLVDDKGIEALRQQITGQFEGQIASLRGEVDTRTKELTDARTALAGEKIGNAFATSKFIADKLAVPVDMVRSTFGGAFKVVDGELVAYKSDGTELFSPTRIGERANFDEAMEQLIGAYPNKDLILKGSGMNGGGSGGGGSGKGGKPSYKRAEVDAMDPVKQGQIYRDMKAGKAEVVD